MFSLLLSLDFFLWSETSGVTRYFNYAYEKEYLLKKFMFIKSLILGR